MDTDWDDLRLFLHVAEQGGLAGAATLTDISAPTIGRRMLALERRLGRSLFVRSQQGYRLAHDGNILVQHVRSMRNAADFIADWHKDAFGWPIVSIAGDSWVAGLIADHAGELRGIDDQFRYCCKTLDHNTDMTFRDVDVAILPERPRGGNLAAKRSITIAYAAYRATTIEPAAMDRWISIGTEMSRTPSDRWAFENHEGSIYTWTGGPELLLRLIRNGAGTGVLPVLVGDADATLMRVGDIIDGLTHPLWIVANDDDRKRPEVRKVIDRLADILRRCEANAGA
ncbi:MAG: LysR family transcriptional regulator [Rhizobium sp.]|nr:LysR family transcriptional regulator [Rhizobium sp.]